MSWKKLLRKSGRASQNPENVAKEKMSICGRAHLAENLDDAPEKDEK